MPPEFDEHILSTMSDEERATILEEQSPEEIRAIAAIANGDEDGPDDDAEDDADDAVDLPAAAAAAAATPVVAPLVALAPPTPSEPFQASYQAKLPEDFAAQQLAIKDRTDDLAARFKSGDIDFDQYRVEAEALSKSERALDQIELKATLSQEMTAQTVEQQWTHTVQKFMAATAQDGGIDYSKDPEKQADLDLFVRTLANDARHADKSAEWFLNEGHKRVQALHGVAVIAALAAPAVADAKAVRKSPLDAAPKTLAQVPGGDGPGDVDGNEFSDIDRLTGDAQEDAIRKMSPVQRERYMLGV